MQVDFNARDHSYSVGGGQIPGVSEILKDQGLSHYPDNDLTIMARNYGQEMHGFTSEYVRGHLSDLDVEGMHPEYRLPLEGVARFIREIPTYPDLAPYCVEEPMAHSKWLYGGTPDLLIPLQIGKYRYALYDWKFGGMNDAYPVQMAAYDMLVRDHFGIAGVEEIDRWLVFVSRVGDVKPVRVPSITFEVQTFLSALTVWRWRKMHGKLDRGRLGK